MEQSGGGASGFFVPYLGIIKRLAENKNGFWDQCNAIDQTSRGTEHGRTS